MDKKGNKIDKNHSDRRKKYNSDKVSVQILKTTHKKMKKYCIDNNITMKEFLNSVILDNLK